MPDSLMINIYMIAFIVFYTIKCFIPDSVKVNNKLDEDFSKWAIIIVIFFF